jgi:hypothetical protein
MSQFRGSIISVTMEARVISQGSRYGIFGEESRTGAGFRSVLYGTYLPVTVPILTLLLWDWDRVAGAATQYGLEYRGFEPRWRRKIFSISVQTQQGLPSLLYYGHPASFLGLQRPERVETTQPLLLTGLKTGTVLYVRPLCAYMVSYEVTFTFTHLLSGNGTVGPIKTTVTTDR